MCNFKVYRDEFNKFTLITKKDYHNGQNDPFLLKDTISGERYEFSVYERIDLGDRIKYVMSLNGFIELGFEGQFKVYDRYNNCEELLLGYICRTKEFDRRYIYNNNDLGVTYSPESSLFKIWSPTATKASILFENGSKVDLEGNKVTGIWEKRIDLPLDGVKYKYAITNNGITNICIDPYAKASSANNEWSVVVDLSRTVQIERNLHPKLKQPTDAIIYELSIRDFTTHGKYIEMIQKIPYIKELGVTHVQLMPIYDWGCKGLDEHNYDSEIYNWGYNPTQFNVPEGSYASDPDDPYCRINELKTLINEFHKAGIGVIMDVVYNHVYDRSTHPFDAIVPTYFFRYDHTGMPTNGSGCGNDVASERYMCRFYILNSIKYWIQEYGIDGFRFDLLGLLDIGTMNEIRKMIYEIQPDTILYGEGWDMNTALPQSEKANMRNMCRLPNIAFFNDTYRDYIKGNSFNVSDRGLILGRTFNSGRHRQLLAGSSGAGIGETYLFNSPAQSINYLECHDGYTLWDKISMAVPHKSKEERQARHMLGLTILILSQGIPFLQSGCEFFRSKNNYENTYNQPDSINKIHWDAFDKDDQWFLYLKQIIKLRKEHGAFRFKNSLDVKEHTTILKHYESVIEYRLNSVEEYGTYKDIRVIFNTQDYNTPFRCPEGFTLLLASSPYDGKTLKGVGTVILVRE